MKFEWKWRAQLAKVFSRNAGLKYLSIRQRLFLGALAYVTVQSPNFFRDNSESLGWTVLEYTSLVVLMPLFLRLVVKSPGFQLLFGWAMLVEAISSPFILASGGILHFIGGLVIMVSASAGAYIFLRDSGLKRYRRLLKFKEDRSIAAANRGFVPYSS